MTGKDRRLARILPPNGRASIVLPVDDSLLSGPDGALAEPHRLFSELARAPVDAFLGFHGLFARFGGALGHQQGMIVNLTASTTLGQHTRKVQVAHVEQALAVGADAVAVHVNFGSTYEHEMLSAFGAIVAEASVVQVPVVAILYPRREGLAEDDNFGDLRRSDPDQYCRMLRHIVRVGVDMGADVIKTQYAGDVDRASSVTSAAAPVPVILAGGPLVDLDRAIERARDAAAAGAHGISFGRNVFLRRDPALVVERLREALDTPAA